LQQPAKVPTESAPEQEGTPASEGAPAAAQPKTTYSMSGGFARLLGRLNLSVGFTSYQSGKLYLLGRNPKKPGLMVDERLFPKAMGLVAEGRTLVLATLFQIQRFENVLEKGQAINHTQDACYVPRVTYTTGVLDAHEIGLMADGHIVFVNTAYNCLAVPSERHSFAPLWMPPFISALVEEDRCHLNGLAMGKGKPRYVTAVSRSDTIDGWRDRRANGGIVIDVETGEIVCSGLSMPHSPRVVDGQLWVLNSGSGELGEIDRACGTFRPRAFCPGFVRGLAIHGRHAFVGLSKPRYKRFEGLALDDKLKATDSEPWCGIQVIDLDSGTCVEWFRMDGAVAEIFDVAVLPGIACPMSLGFASNEIKTLITYEGLKPKPETGAGAKTQPAD
jgi:uncharacterized protein (TIGR03032 family)